MNDEKNLPLEQIIAIKLAILTGKEIAEKCPSIAGDYRAGMTQEQIAEKYLIGSTYSLTNSIATNAVRYALSGFLGLDVPSSDFDKLPVYIGLIPDAAEREQLALDHQLLYASLGGERTFSLGKGIYAMTPMERTEVNRRGGKAGGLVTYQNGRGIYERTVQQREHDARKAGLIGGKTTAALGVGIHAIDPERRKAISKKVGAENVRLRRGIFAMEREELQRRLDCIDYKTIVLKRGDVPYVDDFVATDNGGVVPGEKYFSFYLSTLPSFHNGQRTDINLLAQEINRMYHNGISVRTPGAISQIVTSLRKEYGIVASRIAWVESSTALDGNIIPSEKDFLLRLISLPEYKMGNSIRIEAIARALNETYHSGKEVRTVSAVYSILRRLLQKNEFLPVTNNSVDLK